jgi:hypothetical protein
MDDMDHDMHAGPPPIPILTGFLGAGKTTGLNHILTSDHGLRVAVPINGFGSITIDADLVVGVEGNVISLANGCICCTIRDDLISARRPLRRAALPVCLRAVDGTLEAVRVHGPSGRAKDEGTQAMAEGLKKMTHWHTKAFSGVPEPIYNLTIDAVHTDHYAMGYMIKRVNLRIGMVTLMAYDHELINEPIAGVHAWRIEVLKPTRTCFHTSRS